MTRVHMPRFRARLGLLPVSLYDPRTNRILPIAPNNAIPLPAANRPMRSKDTVRFENDLWRARAAGQHIALHPDAFKIRGPLGDYMAEQQAKAATAEAPVGEWVEMPNGWKPEPLHADFRDKGQRIAEAMGASMRGLWERSAARVLAKNFGGGGK